MDTVVIGAGLNGLTTATLLAQRGVEVVLLDRRPIVGGLCAAEPFHAGYRCSVWQNVSAVRPEVVEALGLGRQGLSVSAGPAPVLAASIGERGILLDGDLQRTRNELASLPGEDATNYPAFRDHIAALAPVLEAFIDRPPLDLIRPEANSLAELIRRGLGVRRLGAETMMDLLRIPPMCVADWLGEWFENDGLRAALALPGVAGEFAGPWSPGTVLNLLLWEVAARSHVIGGPSALAESIEAAARAAGVSIRTECEVRRILVEGEGVQGVELADGETIAARRVASSCDPRTTLLGLLPPGALSSRIEHQITTFRARGTTAVLDLALSRPVAFRGRDVGEVALARCTAGIDALEQAFDPIKYGESPACPALEIQIPTIERPELAPTGGSVVSAMIHYAPRTLDAERDEAARGRLIEASLKQLESYMPGIGSAIVGRRLSMPSDLEQRYGLSGGNLRHGEHGLDQLLVRPVPGCAGYRTPVRGLYLCGGGSHPGGWPSCAPGRHAATTILTAR